MGDAGWVMGGQKMMGTTQEYNIFAQSTTSSQQGKTSREDLAIFHISYSYNIDVRHYYLMTISHGNLLASIYCNLLECCTIYTWIDGRVMDGIGDV